MSDGERFLELLDLWGRECTPPIKKRIKELFTWDKFFEALEWKEVGFGVPVTSWISHMGVSYKQMEDIVMHLWHLSMADFLQSPQEWLETLWTIGNLPAKQRQILDVWFMTMQLNDAQKEEILSDSWDYPWRTIKRLRRTDRKMAIPELASTIECAIEVPHSHFVSSPMMYLLRSLRPVFSKMEKDTNKNSFISVKQALCTA